MATLARQRLRSGRSAYRCRGSTDRLLRTTDLPNPALWSGCGWFRISAAPSTFAELMLVEDSSSNAWCEIGAVFSSPSYVFGIATAPNADSAIFPTNTLVTGAILFAAIVAQSGVVTGYSRIVSANGLQSCSTSSYTFSTATAFGIMNDDSSEWVDGHAWDVRVWSGRALTEREFMIESFAPKPVVQSGLYGWWPLEGTLDQLTNDFSGNGHHLTLAGSPRVERFPFPANLYYDRSKRATVYWENYMANIVFNVAKGRVVEYYNRVKNNDPGTARLVLVPIETTNLEGDAALIDSLSLAEVIDGTTNEQTTMGRKFLTDSDLAAFPGPDTANDRYDVSLPSVTWTAATGNAISKMVVAYDPNSSADSAIIPLTMFDCVVTPDGNDIVLNSGVFFRAA